MAQDAKATVQQATKKRRWISRDLNLSILAPHKEIRNIQTREIEGYELLDGARRVTTWLDIPKCDFTPHRVIVPYGIGGYIWIEVGAFATADPEKIAMCEKYEKSCKRENRKDDCREYAFEDEERLKSQADEVKGEPGSHMEE